jgi:hypothetical protein
VRCGAMLRGRCFCAELERTLPQTQPRAYPMHDASAGRGGAARCCEPTNDEVVCAGTVRLPSQYTHLAGDEPEGEEGAPPVKGDGTAVLRGVDAFPVRAAEGVLRAGLERGDGGGGRFEGRRRDDCRRKDGSARAQGRRQRRRCGRSRRRDARGLLHRARRRKRKGSGELPRTTSSHSSPTLYRCLAMCSSRMATTLPFLAPAALWAAVSPNLLHILGSAPRLRRRRTTSSLPS